MSPSFLLHSFPSVFKNSIKLLILSGLYLSTSCSAETNKVVKILPLGDSITCASKYKVSYRYPLWKKLVDANKKVVFIGSKKGADGNFGRTQWDSYKGLAFPTANECHSGWRTDQVLNGLPNGEKGMDQWLKAYQADIALVHLGTNDVYQHQSPASTRDEIEQVIAKLRNNNPKIKIILARIIPMKTDKHVVQLNQLIAKLARKLNKPESPVISVDMYRGFSINTDMQKDQIHPNAKGEFIMAQRWFNALMKPEMLGK